MQMRVQMRVHVCLNLIGQEKSSPILTTSVNQAYVRTVVI